MSEFGWNLENTYTNLPSKFYRNLEKNKKVTPKIVIFNNELSNSLGLDSEKLYSDKGAEFFTGSSIAENSKMIAQAYCGHQFGYFTMLGDGRAMLLGEQITPDNKRFDIQLKGSGRTIYSRGGDGKAVLGPMLREYIISEAMCGLKIPTTRSLAVTLTGEEVFREVLQPGAVLTRVASSHIRVGTFQFAVANGEREDIKALADYTISRHFNELDNIVDEKEKYKLFLRRVVELQAELISSWQLVGFIHGVMNTDNMSICGETIDYGPCAFMDTYKKDTVFSSIDRDGRYSYKNQPSIGQWNLSRFAETLVPILDDDTDKSLEIAISEVVKYQKIYDTFWRKGMSKKLGIFDEEKDDIFIFYDLLSLMEKYKADYTNTFIDLTFEDFEANELFNSSDFLKWKERWKNRVNKQSKSADEIKALMKNNNPAIIPRNHKVEEAIEMAVSKGDISFTKKLVDLLSNPFEHTQEQKKFSKEHNKFDENYKTYCGT